MFSSFRDITRDSRKSWQKVQQNSTHVLLKKIMKNMAKSRHQNTMHFYDTLMAFFNMDELDY